MKRNILLIVILVVLIGFLFLKTGFLQLNNVDERDLAHWTYEDGVIQGADSFSLVGGNETCWLMLHSYRFTPLEMKVLGERLHTEFGDSVRAVGLEGHGEVPGNLLSLTLDDWYEQVSDEADDLIRSCDHVNIVGSSLGGSLSIRLAEEKDLGNVYLVNSYVYLTRKWYYLFRMENSLWLIGDVLHYYKADWCDGGDICYLNFVFRPIKNSAGFLEENLDRVSEIDENLLVLHSWADVVASPLGARDIYAGASSEVKELKMFEESRHLLLLDSERAEVADEIISFELEHRGS